MFFIENIMLYAFGSNDRDRRRWESYWNTPFTTLVFASRIFSMNAERYRNFKREHFPFEENIRYEYSSSEIQAKFLIEKSRKFLVRII